MRLFDKEKQREDAASASSPRRLAVASASKGFEPASARRDPCAAAGADPMGRLLPAFRLEGHLAERRVARPSPPGGRRRNALCLAEGFVGRHLRCACASRTPSGRRLRMAALGCATSAPAYPGVRARA